MTFMRVVQVPVNDVVVVVAMLTRLVAAGRAVRGMIVVPAVVPIRTRLAVLLADGDRLGHRLALEDVVRIGPMCG